MTPAYEAQLSSQHFEVLDNAIRARRCEALLVPGAPSPIKQFQQDLLATARLMGFVPRQQGHFWVRMQPGGSASLCWAPTDAGQTLH
ncbi:MULTISPECIES: hypothetical protein [Pseudomonas]|uniref:hypothetical protein n=1 Tax=Pseudomonas TaxID=286 RepID=UPI001C231682|nr:MULTISPECIES: hypothetical protein [Pseudomonas]